jgi:hypothetical protein
MLRNLIGVYGAQFILPDGSPAGVDSVRDDGCFELAISDLAGCLIPTGPELDDFGAVGH